jgi:hypothetical protein
VAAWAGRVFSLRLLLEEEEGASPHLLTGTVAAWAGHFFSLRLLLEEVEGASPHLLTGIGFF